MPSYQLLKHAHIGCAALTILLFLLRGALRWARPALLATRPLRIAPHLIDTLLLACAIGLLTLGRINPLTTPWVLAKIFGVLLYIMLGSIALKRGQSPAARLSAFAGALAVLGYIVAVAFSKQVWPL